MKNTLLTVFLFLCLCGGVSAQNTDDAAIKGIVVDSLKNQPMGYVTVALIDGQNGKAVKSTFTKENGGFELTGLAVKPYKLTLVFVGYASKTINISNVVKGTDLGRILLSTATNQLKDVSVTAVKPLMKREVDRLTYDVQADPENKVISVLDMMRRVPLLSVDATDNIKLQGNANYKILINGKPSALVAQNPADVLKSMPASNIQKIEVITTPRLNMTLRDWPVSSTLLLKKILIRAITAALMAGTVTCLAPVLI